MLASPARTRRPGAAPDGSGSGANPGAPCLHSSIERKVLVMQMSTEAMELMQSIAATYVAKGFPNHRAWYFDPNTEDVLHAELRALGLIRLTGTKGSPWGLTDAGHEWVMQHREVK